MKESDIALEDLKRLTLEAAEMLGPFAFKKMIMETTQKIERELLSLRALVGSANLGPSFREIIKDFPRAPKAGEA